ncbi:MAG TPA: aminotransferase class III-fold pyridoxal phosphate-dependent enzyme [Candidatus Dormibacteraeota bacterium]|nr:aminotransferase class III-fold pyridoxal phosphate-dependent enzyme [Candidatus Dormibacteraeota bacterium]
MNPDELTQLHAQHVLTPWVAMGSHRWPMIVRGEGSYLFDAEGKRYLDFASGLISVNLGHGHPKVVAAIQEQAARLCYAAPSFLNDKRAELAAELSRLAPWSEGARVHFTTGGGEANEDAVKISRIVTGRYKILTAYRSFHGSAPGAGSLTGENRRYPNEPGIPGVVHFWAPFPYRSPFHTTDPREETKRALEHLELVISYENPERIAAVLLEPVVGSNGVIVYPEDYLRGVREVCDRHGILFIADEVMTGFGRTGEVFGHKRFGFVPDLVTFAKGVTSSYVPLGGVLVRESLATYFDDRPMMLGHTYSGHPLAMAAGVATLRAYREAGLYERGREIEGWLRRGLEELQRKHSVIGEVRGVGAFFAIELVKDRATREPLVEWQGKSQGPMPAFFVELRKRGVYTFGRYNVVVAAPPLTAKQSEVDEGLAALDGALSSLAVTA